MSKTQDSDRALLCLDQKNLRFERLKLAVRDYDYNIEINCVVSVGAALQRLGERNYAAVIIAPEFDQAELKQFIAAMLDRPGGQDVAVVMIISSQKGLEMEEEMSMGLLIGANGFLKDPFSTKGVQETLHLSQVIRKERLEKRQKKSIGVHLREARELIDHAARMRQLNQRSDFKGTEVAPLRVAIQKCVAENPDLYYRLIVGSFVRLALMKRPLSAENYNGKSKRVLRQIAEKMDSSPDGESTHES